MTDTLLEDLDRRLAGGEPVLAVYKHALRESRTLRAEQFARGVRASLLVHQAALFTDAIMQRASAAMVAVSYTRRQTSTC
jgi:[protein-PII] uridylyltransferase